MCLCSIRSRMRVPIEALLIVPHQQHKHTYYWSLYISLMSLTTAARLSGPLRQRKRTEQRGTCSRAPMHDVACSIVHLNDKMPLENTQIISSKIRRSYPSQQERVIVNEVAKYARLDIVVFFEKTKTKIRSPWKKWISTHLFCYIFGE